MCKYLLGSKIIMWTVYWNEISLTFTDLHDSSGSEWQSNKLHFRMVINGSFHYALGKCFLKDLLWTGFGCVNGFSLRHFCQCPRKLLNQSRDLKSPLWSVHIFQDGPERFWWVSAITANNFAPSCKRYMEKSRGFNYPGLLEWHWQLSIAGGKYSKGGECDSVRSSFHFFSVKVN